MEFETVLINRYSEPRRLVAEAVGVIDDKRYAAEDTAHLAGDGASGLGIGSIDLGEEGREDGRAGRHFHDFERCAIGKAQVLQSVSDVERDGVTGPFARVFWTQVDLEIALLRFGPQIGMPHESIEVEWRGCAYVRLDRRQLR